MLIIKGKVQKGRGLGKKLGFPTLNLPYEGKEAGVFAAQVWINGLLYKGAVHLGPRPTLNDEQPICEVYLLDYQCGDLSGEVKVVMIEKIREIAKFPSFDALKVQIAEDVVKIENLLK